MSAPAPATPQEQVQQLQKSVAAGDLARMMAQIGDIHERWAHFSAEQQTEIEKMEAVFLSMLKAKAGA